MHLVYFCSQSQVLLVCCSKEHHSYCVIPANDKLLVTFFWWFECSFPRWTSESYHCTEHQFKHGFSRSSCFLGFSYIPSYNDSSARVHSFTSLLMSWEFLVTCQEPTTRVNDTVCRGKFVSNGTAFMLKIISFCRWCRWVRGWMTCSTRPAWCPALYPTRVVSTPASPPTSWMRLTITWTMREEVSAPWASPPNPPTRTEAAPAHL